MKNRDERIQMIRRMIETETIGSQDELQSRLLELGCDVTQATLSRDLKAMQVVKISDATHGYLYRLSKAEMVQQEDGRDDARMNFLSEGVIGIEFSGNLGVMKTMAGYAGGVALAIDNSGMNEIMGTIAGDDTILLVMREGIGRNDVIRALKNMMPRLENRI